MYSVCKLSNPSKKDRDCFARQITLSSREKRINKNEKYEYAKMSRERSRERSGERQETKTGAYACHVLL